MKSFKFLPFFLGLALVTGLSQIGHSEARIQQDTDALNAIKQFARNQNALVQAGNDEPCDSVADRYSDEPVNPAIANAVAQAQLALLGNDADPAEEADDAVVADRPANRLVSGTRLYNCISVAHREEPTPAEEQIPAAIPDAEAVEENI